MGYKEDPTVLQSSGTEKDFFTLIFNYITSIDESITVSVTKWDSTTGDYITIDNATANDVEYVLYKYTVVDFILDSTNDIRLRFKTIGDRGYYESQGPTSNCYNVGLYCGNLTVAESNGMDSSSWGTNSTKVVFCYPDTIYTNWHYVYCNEAHERKMTATKYVDDNIMICWFESYDSQSYKTPAFSFMKFKVSERDPETHEMVEVWKWAACTNSPNVLNDGRISNAAGTATYTISNMFPFEARTGYLDFVSHSSFLSGSTKVFASTDIYDCTTVNFGDTLSLKDGANFLAIGAHSMVRLDEEG